jgi:hypothetical protein
LTFYTSTTMGEREPNINDDEMRNIDREAENPRFNQRPQRPNRERGEHRPREQDNVSTMLELVSDILTTPARQPRSSYVPSALFLGRVTQEISIIMNEDFRTIRSHPDFHPLLFNLYIQTMWCLQVTRVRCDANVATNAERHLMRNLTQAGIFNYRIPGPLVLFFKALAAGTPETECFDLIAPASLHGLTTVGVALDLDDDCLNILPPLPYLRHAYNSIRVRFLPNARNAWINEDWRCYHLAAGAANAPLAFDHTDANRHRAQARLSPGLSEYDYPMDSQFKNIYTWMQMHPLAIPADPNPGLMTLAEYLGMNVNFRWFIDLAESMNWVCEYWNNSERLEDVARIGPVAGQIIALNDETYANDNDLRDATGSSLDFAVYVSTPQMTPDQTLVKLAALSQINWRCPDNYGLNPHIGSHLGPTATQVGPFWARTPDSVISSSQIPTVGLRKALEKMRRSVN